MSRSRSSKISEPYKLVLLLMAERGFKKCIDNLSTDPRLNHLRALDPSWNIMREFRSQRPLIKLLVDTLIERISDVDASNLETLNLESCYRVHQVLRVIRGLDPSWSINGSVRFGVLN